MTHLLVARNKLRYCLLSSRLACNIRQRHFWEYNMKRPLELFLPFVPLISEVTGFLEFPFCINLISCKDDEDFKMTQITT
jgi:hypothetical protein